MNTYITSNPKAIIASVLCIPLGIYVSIIPCKKYDPNILIIVINKAANTILTISCFCLNNLLNSDINDCLVSFVGLYSIPGTMNKVIPVHSFSKRSYDILVIPTSGAGSAIKIYLGVAFNTT